MTEFVSIANAKETHQGNFKGSCIKKSDLKSGTAKNGDWTMKKFTLQDASAEIEIAAFNEEIQFFEVGQFYEVVNPKWKEYTDRNDQKQWSCNVGKSCTVTAINPPIAATTPKSDETPPKPTRAGEEIPAMQNTETLGFVDTQTLLLLQIREAVKVRMLMYSPRLSEVNGAELGGYTLEIYRQYRKHKEKMEV